ncbi:hypothetical protein BY458DRAFT_456202 [Sporodiniella umbellata]|nr:hypothetical protein BY458DRAFT_456202 [Sporodiniella umbellata]
MLANWRTGSVQQLRKIDDCKSRLLSVKLKNNLLLTLTEDNYVRLYRYNSDTGFSFQYKWFFGDTYISSNRVECIELFPEMNLMVVAQKGSKCMIYDLQKPKNLPIQTLKGGSCLLFIPDSIAINKDYLAIIGRKPSFIYVWNWRKGTALTTKVLIDDIPHQIFLYEEHLISINSNGIFEVFNLLEYDRMPIFTYRVSACSIPCVEYNSSLSIISAPHQSKRINFYQLESSLAHVSPPINTPLRKRFSLAYLLGRDNEAHTSNSSKESTSVAQNAVPDFGVPPKLVNSIDTSPFCSAATKIVNMTVYQDRIATVNKQGQMALYALNGTTATLVNTKLLDPDIHQEWVDCDKRYSREDDDLSDGYDFVRSILAMGPMGVIYGAKNGSIWWLDFGCRVSSFPSKSKTNNNNKSQAASKAQ